MSFLLCRTLTLPTPPFPSTSFPIPHKCRGRCNKTTATTPTTATAIREMNTVYRAETTAILFFLNRPSTCYGCCISTGFICVH